MDTKKISYTILYIVLFTFIFFIVYYLLYLYVYKLLKYFYPERIEGFEAEINAIAAGKKAANKKDANKAAALTV
jgi:hypothetical protein